MTTVINLNGISELDFTNGITAASTTKDVTTLTLGGASPGGSAGGDLSGTYPNPSVAKLLGAALNSVIGSAGAGQDGQVIYWDNASSSYKLKTVVTTVTWDAIQNAAGNLTLANAGFSTTFNQTSAVNWTWANTTAATNIASQSSPILNIVGQYWNGSASAADTWTLQNVLSNGTNGASVLSFVHTGTSGLAGVGFPNGSSGKPSIVFTSTIGLSSVSGFWVDANHFLRASSIGFIVDFPGTYSDYFEVGTGGCQVASISTYGWSSGNTPASTYNDLQISRKAAGVLAVGTTSTVGDMSGAVKSGPLQGLIIAFHSGIVGN